MTSFGGMLRQLIVDPEPGWHIWQLWHVTATLRWCNRLLMTDNKYSFLPEHDVWQPVGKGWPGLLKVTVNLALS